MSRPLAAAVLLIACGGNDGGGGADAGSDTDGGTGVDAMPVRCDAPLVDFELGDLGMLDFRAVVEPAGGGAQYIDLFASIAPGPMVDVVQIQLWPLGVFAGGLAPGTYEIAGPETDFYSCGACALVIADYDLVGDTFEQQMMASAGTLQLDAVSTTPGEMITGTLTGALFREVALDDPNQTQSNVPGGCTTAIDSVQFSAVLQDN